MSELVRWFAAAALACALAPSAFPLDPHKGLTQYSRKLWTQQNGLPQDTIRAIGQTTDGYLWLGTDEGLARFDGYDFTVFNKENSKLPSNTITALCAGLDGSLWIGTGAGLTRYQNREFHTYTTKDGLPDDGIGPLFVDHAGTLWIVAGTDLAEYDGHKFTVFAAGKDLPLNTVRTVYEDRHHVLWVGGFGGIVKKSGERFVPVLESNIIAGDAISRLAVDDHDNLWIGGSSGMIVLYPDGRTRLYTTRDGLPDLFIRAMWLDRDGNLWAGTNNGLARFQNNRFVTLAGLGGRFTLDEVRSLFEDREGNLWVGDDDGLIRMRDDIFSDYGVGEGLPGYDASTVLQDHAGRIWIGYRDSGLVLFSPDGYKQYTRRDGLPSDEVFSIRETRGGELLVGTRDGLARGMASTQGIHFTNFRPPDPLARYSVYDSLEDSSGRLWLGLPQGLGQLVDGKLRMVIQGGPLLNTAFVALLEARDGALWAGTFGRGLWRVKNGQMRQFTTADGLSSDNIRSIREDRDGTLWIATFGGGLNEYRNGKFFSFAAKDGLLSDNISGVADDGQSLWLSTTRGVCRISKQQLQAFANHALSKLEPTNYGIDDGLRSAQCAPGYPIPGGVRRTSDGRLWFPTSRGLAVIDPALRRFPPIAPTIHLLGATADGEPIDFSSAARLKPGTERLQFRYTAIHLSAPERVQYWLKLEGLDSDWVRVGARRVSDFNSLKHGKYRFMIRAVVPGGAAAERSYAFEVLPAFYETIWFRLLALLALAGLGWALYHLRLRQERYRFALVLEERARLAREIHDTLAQGFVGIASQLDAVAMAMPDQEGTPWEVARQYLDLARKMARHSLTEARRAVMDLRASVLEGRDLATALNSGAQMWTAGSGVEVEVDVSGERKSLPPDMEQHLLRIAQEAVTNVLKHAGASKICLKLHMEAKKLFLRVADNGHGFEHPDAFSPQEGHFGLLGMRERAERLGGELHLASHPGEGTEVEVTVPLK
ncbi:MAG TPA: two-component regulator propeller domain-containing protein [Bryobacteraceae bacterium]|nr:two-component regulator propeller domain-containing protein [Bryobacteraceae bacterium]